MQVNFTLILDGITVLASGLLVLLSIRKKNNPYRIHIRIVLLFLIGLTILAFVSRLTLHYGIHLIPWLIVILASGFLYFGSGENSIQRALRSPLRRSKAHHAFGLAVADSSLELVNVVLDKEKLAVNYFARVPLESGVIERGYIRKFDAFQAAINELFSPTDGKEKNRTVVSAFPDYQVFTRLLKIDRADFDKKGLDAFVLGEMSKSLPVELNEVTIRTLTHEASENTIEVMIFAAYNSLIQNWVKNFQQAGLNITGIEMESLALIRSLIKECPINVAYFIADLGGSSSDLTIVDCYGIKLSASIASGGKYLTKRVAEELQLTLDDAETQKRQIGLTEQGHSTVALVLAKGLQEIVDKINKEISYYEHSGKHIEKIFLAGGTSGMPGIVEYFSKQCGRSAERGHPWTDFESDIVGSFKLSTKNLPKDQEHFYAGATGLALKGLNRGHLKKGINFLE
ncbi:MAG: pilus assembly protein PilM [Candidatus Komeilibacteria bacterium]|nr:pilus assembly protein PilM [Candidatus Komeilibacteria bacterium]